MALTDTEQKALEEKLTKAISAMDTLTNDAVTMKADNERLSAKVSEANKHTKAAEKAAEEAARTKADKDGDYKQLLKSAEEKIIVLTDSAIATLAVTAKSEVKGAALKLAGLMSEGVNIENIAHFIEQRLKFADGRVKVTNESGELTVSTLEDLQKEFTGSARYASLLKGNKSSGGGAPPGNNNNSGSAAKTITRTEFNALDSLAQANVMLKDGKQTGVTIIDE